MLDIKLKEEEEVLGLQRVSALPGSRWGIWGPRPQWPGSQVSGCRCCGRCRAGRESPPEDLEAETGLSCEEDLPRSAEASGPQTRPKLQLLLNMQGLRHNAASNPDPDLTASTAEEPDLSQTSGSPACRKGPQLGQTSAEPAADLHTRALVLDGLE